MAKKTIEKTQPMPAPPPVDDHDEDLEEEEDEDEHDEHDPDEEDDEDEDEEEHAGPVVAHSTRTVPGRMPLAPVIAPHEATPEDPTWWLPHAVLGTLIVVGILGFFGVFTGALYPAFVKMGLFPAASAHASGSASAADAPHPPASTKPAAPTPTAPPKPTMQLPVQPRPVPSAVQPAVETFAAKHIVVAYKGSLNADPKVTRSKDDAKKRANEVHGKLKKGGKWDELVAQYSDEVGAGSRFGNLGRFTAATFDKAFIEAVRKLKKDEMSEVVETPMGFHVIVRTE